MSCAPARAGNQASADSLVMHPAACDASWLGGVLGTGAGMGISGVAMAGKSVACAGRLELATASGSFQPGSATEVSIGELNETAVALR